MRRANRLYIVGWQSLPKSSLTLFFSFYWMEVGLRKGHRLATVQILRLIHTSADSAVDGCVVPHR